MWTRIAPAAFALALLPAAGLAAQRVTLDVRGAVALPTTTLAEADLPTGLSLGGTVALRLMPHLSVYGGWDWLRFGGVSSFAGVDDDFEETGYTFGLRFEHPFAGEADGGLHYRAEVGGTYKHIEIENAAGDPVADTKHDLGYEGGFGLVLPLGNGPRLVGMARYRSLSRDFVIGTETTAGNLRYIALELGVSWPL
jgi:hypothetical protein